jgi:radical SAM protein with 4Fe4S-binding SPASM domain
METEYRLKELKIEVTYRCPLACVHCSSDASPSCSLELNLQKSIDIIEEAVGLGLEKIAFSGGEPLIWQGIKDVVKLAASHKLEVIIYTSGNVDNIEELLNKLKDNGLHKLVFSIFGTNSKEHEHITRKKGSFNSTINAVISANKIGITTEFHFVALARNYFLLPGIAQLSKQYNVDKVSVLRFVPQGRGLLLAPDVLNKIQNKELQKSILALRKMGYNIRTGSPYNFLLVNDFPQCLSAVDRLIIAPDLRIYPCDAFKQVRAHELVGTEEFSILDNEPLEKCWLYSPYLNAIREFVQGSPEEPCQSCNNFNKCLSGCLAQKVLSNGRLVRKPDPSCIFAS